MKSSLAILILWICVSIDATTENDCPEPLKVENAFVSPSFNKTSYKPGDKVEYTCENGYISLRKITYICSEKKWSKLRDGECTPKRCEQPSDIPNGRYTILNGNRFVVGTTIEYTCNDGFQMMTRLSTRTCRHGGWDNQLPECEEVFCVADVPPDSHVKVEGLTDNENVMRYGHRLQFSCEQGHILRGEKELICQSNGKWNHPLPKCEEPTCLLNLTEDIKVERDHNQEGPIKPGQSIKLSCVNQGQIIRGVKQFLCQNNGEWNRNFPKCEEATCIANITNMNVNIKPDLEGRYKPGTTLQVSCKREQKLILQGQDKVTCQEDGEWSSTFPSCVAKNSCEPPPNMNHINADTKFILDSRKTEYMPGEKVEYTCFNTYRMEGDTHLTCEQGNWKGNFTCIEPFLASVEEMDKRNIQLKKGGRDRLYCPHLDYITFECQSGKYKKRGSVAFRQQCKYGKMALPECE